ncbi:MAG: dihydropteroate synthase [Spirochaetales bacterium]|nr:dihydropteroate synthase [Spirochaetales bacterium]
MGILNITPDSFYPDSRTPNFDTAFKKAGEMIADGADILDIGGESTRPGSDPISVEEEIQRVVPLIKALKNQWNGILSIDTKKIEVASAALDAGVDMINTVSGLREDDRFARLVAEAGVPVVLMHMQGTPKTMQEQPHYTDPVNEIKHELQLLADHAMACGIKKELIILDPGIGFGKRVSDNLAILNYIRSFRESGFPLLIGLSRKSFLDAVTGRSVEDRLAGTIAAQAVAALSGANILRVHDVKEAVDTIKVVQAIADSK